MYNTLAYIIYLFITYLVTVHVGFIFYKNGRRYLLNLWQGNEGITDSINRILLTGYYLLNLGYAAIMIRFWEKVDSYAELVSSISTMTGSILLTLGLVHFFNMAVILLISRMKSINHH